MSMTQAVVSHPQAGVLTMQTDFAALKTRIAQMQQFVREYMTPGEDFGVIEGTGKPTLLKPGAEKLCDVYGLSAGEAQIDFTRDDTKTPTYIAYRVSLPLVSRADGRVIMVGVGSCNSWEKKYRWRWVFDNELPVGMSTDGLQIKTGNGKNGRAWTKYRVPNDEIDDVDNTLLKMAKKRALIDAVLSATRSSALFTQDIEDEDMAVRGADTTERDEKRQSTSSARPSGPTRQGSPSTPAPKSTPNSGREAWINAANEAAAVQARLGLDKEMSAAVAQDRWGKALKDLTVEELHELRDHYLQMEREHLDAQLHPASQGLTDEEMAELPF